MPDHKQPELTGSDQAPQSDEFLPVWGWWLLALGIAVVSTASFWFARIFYYYYSEENPSGLQGLHVGDPPIPFRSTEDKVWLYAAGAAVGLFVLAATYATRARHQRLQDGWTSAAKHPLAAAVFLLVGATASLATFSVFFIRSP